MLASNFSIYDTYQIPYPNQNLSINESINNVNNTINTSNLSTNIILDEFNNITDLNNTNQTSTRLDFKYSFMFIINFQVILFNGLIIAHVLKAKSFQKSSSAKYFILSLATSDILVGICVMPLGIISLIVNHWLFGKLWCELWQVVDFFSCTASIFNLCTVSIDRYIAISKPLIYMKMSNTRVCLIIALVWLSAALITWPPMLLERFGYMQDICHGEECTNCGSLFDYYPIYIVFSCISSFFLPVLLVCITNYRTYLIVKRHMFARTNNGRISLTQTATAKQQKSTAKKQNFFFNFTIFFCKKETKNCPIELNSLDNQQNRNQTVPIKNKTTSLLNRHHSNHHLINEQQKFNNQFNYCCCNHDLLDRKLYLHSTATTTTNLKNRSIFNYLRINRLLNCLFNRDYTNNIESKIISSNHNTYYSSCNNHQHFHTNLHELNSFTLNEQNTNSKGVGINRLKRYFIRCCNLNGCCNLTKQSSLSSSSSLSKFENIKMSHKNCKSFFFINNNNNNNNNSNIKILDELTNSFKSNNNNQIHYFNNNLKQCTHCALNSLNNSIQLNGKINQIDQQFKCSRNLGNELFSNEELFIDDEESGLSLNSKNRLENSNKDVLSNLSILGNNSRDCNEEIVVNELNSTNTNDANTIIDSINLSNNSPNNNSHQLFKSSSSKSYLDCCGYCCNLCCLECYDCKNELNKLLVDIFRPPSSNNNSIKNRKNKNNNNNNNSKLTNKPKLCKPQHHLNCTHFKNNQLINSKNQLKTMSIIRCDLCGNTILNDQNCKNNINQHSKQLCLNKFTNNYHLENHHLCLSQHNHYQQQKCNQIRSLNNNLHFNQQTHHCIHSHFQHLNQQRQQLNSSSIYSEPMSAESESNRSTQGINSNVNSGTDKDLDNQQSKTSANNSSFDDELRIYYGTGQLQKQFFNSNPRNKKNTNSDTARTVARSKKLTAYAGNRTNTIKREYRATKTLAIITLVFICMWLPYYTIFILTALFPDSYIIQKLSSYLLHHFLWLGWSNSYINCLLYMYFSRKLRNSVLNTLLCRKKLMM